MLKLWPALRELIANLGVECTHNAAELALRGIVIKRKIFGQTR